MSRPREIGGEVSHAAFGSERAAMQPPITGVATSRGEGRSGRVSTHLGGRRGRPSSEAANAEERVRNVAQLRTQQFLARGMEPVPPEDAKEGPMQQWKAFKDAYQRAEQIVSRVPEVVDARATPQLSAPYAEGAHPLFDPIDSSTQSSANRRTSRRRRRSSQRPSEGTNTASQSTDQHEGKDTSPPKPPLPGNGGVPNDEERPNVRAVTDFILANIDNVRELHAQTEEAGNRRFGEVFSGLLRHGIRTAEGEQNPEQFIRSLAPFAEATAAEFASANAAKKETVSEPVELGLPPEELQLLRTQIDQIMLDDNYIDRYNATLVQPLARHYRELDEDERERIANFADKTFNEHYVLNRFLGGAGDLDSVKGVMRSDDRCKQQVEELRKELPHTQGGRGLVRGYGDTSTHFWHEVLLVTPSQQTAEQLVGLQAARGFPEQSYPIVSMEGVVDLEVPPLGELTIVDPTVIQMFDSNPFLTGILPEDRVAFAQSIAPDSFSEGGIFVDTYINYVRFLANIGVNSASFHPTNSTEMHPHA